MEAVEGHGVCAGTAIARVFRERLTLPSAGCQLGDIILPVKVVTLPWTMQLSRIGG